MVGLCVGCAWDSTLTDAVRYSRAGLLFRSSCGAQRGRHAHGAHRRSHIMRANDRGALEHRDRPRREPALETLVDRQIEQAPDEALPGDADHDRSAECRELLESRDQLEVVLDRLAEADAGIER